MPDQNIALSVQVPDAMKSISGMLNFAGQALDVKKKAETLAADIERAKAESSRAGTEATVAAETAQPRIAHSKSDAEIAATNAARSAFALQGDQSQAAMQIAGGLFRDPRIQDDANPAGKIEAISEARDAMVARGVPKPTADWYTSQLISKAHQPGAVYQGLQNFIQANAGGTSQAGVLNAPLTPVGTGPRVEFKQLQPGAPGAQQAGSSARVEPGPTQAETASTDALGRPVVQTRDATGRIDYRFASGSGKPLMTLPAGETADTGRALMGLRDQAQAAAAQAPGQHFNNQQILRLADNAFTGTKSEQLAKVLNAVGVQNVSGETAKDTAQLRHFLALEVETNAKSIGANTDAARALAERAVLPTDTPGEAIKKITRINDAYVTAKELFNRGMDTAIKRADNTKDIFAVRDFQNAWTQNFDPNLVRLYNAFRESDKKEADAIAKELGPDRMKSLLPKYKALKGLIETGKAN